METVWIYEIIGYVASVLIAVSLMMSKIVRLRVVNLIGAAFFALYGVLIESVPVAGMNGFIVLINIYYLWKIYSTNEYFNLLRVSSDDEYLKAFVRFHEEGIISFQPEGLLDLKHNNFCVFILRDMVPAGVIAGNKGSDGVLNVQLDFVIPQFRDFKIGNYLYNQKRDFFREMGISEIRTRAGNSAHNHYLEKMDFEAENEMSNWYTLKL